MSSLRKVKILLADDHQVVRNGLILMLNHQKAFIPEISEAEDGNDVIFKVENGSYDIVIMDVNMNKRSGISATKYLTSKFPNVKILGLSMHNEDYVIKQMISAGAMGYLLKNTGIEELTKAILSILESRRYFSSEVSQSIMNINNIINLNQKRPNDTEKKLSVREKQILFLIASELTSNQISVELNLSIRTIEGHRRNILRKLNIQTTAGLIKYAVHNGII